MENDRSDEVNILQQVADQCKVVAHLATEIAKVHADYATIFAMQGAGPSELADLVGRRTALLMEELGDVLNGMDAVSDDSEWTEPVFARAHDLFPPRAENAQVAEAVGWGDPEEIDRVEAEVKLILATDPPAPVAPVVKVKELDWSSYGGLRWRARSPLGRFTVNPDSDRRFYVSVNGDPLPGRHPTSDDAMAAAQADYSARIMSALEAPAPQAEVTEGMIERAARGIATRKHGLGDTEACNAEAVDYYWPKYKLEAYDALRAALSIGESGR